MTSLTSWWLTFLTVAVVSLGMHPFGPPWLDDLVRYTATWCAIGCQAIDYYLRYIKRKTP